MNISLIAQETFRMRGAYRRSQPLSCWGMFRSLHPLRLRQGTMNELQLKHSQHRHLVESVYVR